MLVPRPPLRSTNPSENWNVASGVIRQIALNLLHGAVEVESQIFFYEVNERSDFLWFERLRVNAP